MQAKVFGFKSSVAGVRQRNPRAGRSLIDMDLHPRGLKIEG
jgi:hypothetical protein